MCDDYPHEVITRRAGVPSTSGKPFVMWALLTINLGAWLAVSIVGSTEDPELLLDFGAMFGPLVAQGESWRLLTALFLHVGIPHLAFNSLALFMFGQLVEGLYGHTKFIIIYMVSGLAGSIASYTLSPIGLSVGASGAIFGVLGAFGAYFVAQRHMLGTFAQRNLIAIVFLAAVNLIYGLITPGIDNWAHLGGILGGSCIGFILAPRFRILNSLSFGLPKVLVDVNPLTKRWWIAPVAGSVLLIGFLQFGLGQSDNPYAYALESERHLEDSNYEAALEAVNAAIALDTTFAEGYFIRGVVLNGMGDIKGARSDFGRAFQLGNRNTRGKALTHLLALETH